MTRYLALVAFLATLVCAVPAPAQTNDQRPKPAQPGGITLDLGGVFGALLTEATRQAAERAIENPGQPAAAPSNAPASKKTAPSYRDVPAPPKRPGVFDGRPVLFAGDYDAHELVVLMIAQDAGKAAMSNSLRSIPGLTLIGEHHFQVEDLIAYRYRLPPDADVADMAKVLMGIPGVLAVQPQYYYRATGKAVSVTDLRGLQYAPERLNARLAHEAGNGTGVTIGLIDTGVDIAQPVLADAAIETFDVLNDKPVSGRDHGTALAGLMLATHNFDGMAPGARLLSVRAFDTDLAGTAVSTSFAIASAIDLAIAKGAQVLNLSFAGPRDPLVLSVLDAAHAAGVVLVAAAGNDGPEAAPAYPGAHRDAIAVTATDSHDLAFSDANRGRYIAVAAPGVDVLSPLPNARFELTSGTSIAAAHVSAIVALMLEHDPGLRPDDIRKRIEATARDLGTPGPDDTFGAGLADAAAAVAARD